MLCQVGVLHPFHRRNIHSFIQYLLNPLWRDRETLRSQQNLHSRVLGSRGWRPTIVSQHHTWTQVDCANAKAWGTTVPSPWVLGPVGGVAMTMYAMWGPISLLTGQTQGSERVTNEDSWVRAGKKGVCWGQGVREFFVCPQGWLWKRSLRVQYFLNYSHYICRSWWLGWETLEKEMATHSSILAWRNPMDRGAWWATVHGVTKSQTRLSD